MAWQLALETPLKSLWRHANCSCRKCCQLALLIELIRDKALSRPCAYAHQKAANRIIRMRYSQAAVMPGATEVLAYGMGVTPKKYLAFAKSNLISS